MQNKLVRSYIVVYSMLQGEGVTGHLGPAIYLRSKTAITSHLQFKHSFSEDIPLPRSGGVQGFFI